MIQDKLEYQIHNHVMETAKEPKFIVMHPQTWANLVEEVISKDGMAIDRYYPNMKYRGIKVFRSLDLPINDFLTTYKSEDCICGNSKEKISCGYECKK